MNLRSWAARARSIHLLPMLAALLTAGLLAGACGTAARSSADSGPSSGSSVTPGTTNTTPVTRPAPIIYRPAGLSKSQAVPLLVGFYGYGGSPQGTEGLTHFEQLANRYGFEVFYPGSDSTPYPWLPRFDDLQYVSSMIDQLEAPGNPYGAVDPNRVYFTGFSAGGNITFTAGCQLTQKVAAIAVVSMNMRPSLYQNCPVTRPVSEMLIVGTGPTDQVRYAGVPGRVPSAAQVTAKFRAIDGCPSQPSFDGNVATDVTEQAWTGCTDGTSVVLYVIQGGGHAWPGPHAQYAPDTELNASFAIWSFFSSHPGAPLSLKAADARLTAVAIRSSKGKRQLIVHAGTGEPGVTLKVKLGTLRAHVFKLTNGYTRVVFTLPPKLKTGRYALTLVLTDSYGRSTTSTRRLRVPKH